MTRAGPRVLAARAGRGRDPPGAAARAGAGRGPGPHPALRGQPGHRDAGLPRRGAAEPVRRDARAVPGGRLPGAGEVRLPQRRRRRGRVRPSCVGRTVFCLYPHQTAYVVPAAAVTVGARRRAARARRARRHRRDRGQRAVGRRAAGRRPGHRRRARAWSAAASPGCSRGSPGVEVTLVDVDPSRADVAAALGVGFASPDGRGRRSRPRRAHQRDVGRAAAVAGPARAGGHRDRPQLVRRPRVDALARRRVPLRPADDPRQPGRHGVARPGAAGVPSRPAGARARPAARPGLRRAAHRRVARSTSCPTCMAAARRREPARRCATRSPTTTRGRTPCSA